MSISADIISLTPTEVLSLISQSPTPDSQKTLYDTACISVPNAVRARTPPHLSLPELNSMLSYKLAIGVNRPFLRGMLKKNTSSQVEQVSQRAFAVSDLAEDNWEAVKGAMDVLCELKGVGPALASLVLSLLYPHQIPFFSDEAAVEILQPKDGRKGLKYTMKEYKLLFGGLAEMKERINARTGESETRVGNGDVGRAIWIKVRERDGVKDESKKGSKKRKAEESSEEGQTVEPAKKRRSTRKG